jgi:hypothetical protein
MENSTNLLDRFTPKRIILDAIRDKLEGTGINKLVLVFNVRTDTYNVMFSTQENKSINIDIEEKEVTMLKKIFVNKVERKVRQEFKKDFDSLIFTFDMKKDDIEIFIEDIFKNVTKFDY